MWKGWILSQLLILTYYYIDIGVQTCGLDFHFDNHNEDEETASIHNPGDSPGDNIETDMESAQNVVSDSTGKHSKRQKILPAL